MLVTEWNQYRQLDLNHLGEIMKRRAFLDCRNVYSYERLAEHGFAYDCFGRPRDSRRGGRRVIHGVHVKPLKVIPDERGYLYEMLRNDDPFFQQFGQCYLTAVYPGVVKGWHWHTLQTDHFVCVKGMAKVVLYDRREDSPTHGEVNEFFMGERNPHPGGHPQRRPARHEGHRHRDGDDHQPADPSLQPRRARRTPRRSARQRHSLRLGRPRLLTPAGERRA